MNTQANKPNWRKIFMRLSEGVLGGIGAAVIGVQGHYAQLTRESLLSAALLGVTVAARSLWTNPKDAATETPVASDTTGGAI